MPTVIIWGAGKIGRGPAADMFQSAGWHIIFTRRSPDFVRKMRDAGSYQIVRSERDKGQQTIVVKDYEVYSTDQVEELADAVVRADLILVPVMPPQLAQVAQQLAPGLLRRRAARPDDRLDILPCANMVCSAEHMTAELRKALPADALDYFEQKIGIVETLARQGATDPPEDASAEDPAMVYTGGPGYLAVDQDAFKGPIPDVPGLVLVHDPATASMLKIWHGNMSHCFTALRGWLRGHKLMHDCYQDAVVVADVKSAMKEAADALLADGRGTPEYFDERLNVYGRHSNPEYRDTIRRVAADPRRKLAREDRFVGPLLLARRYGLPFANLARGIACGLLYDNAEDAEAVWIQQRIGEIGLRAAVFEVCGFNADESDVVDEILAQHAQLEQV